MGWLSNAFSGGKGGFDLADPLKLGAGNTKFNPARKAAVDPLGAFYKPPEDPDTYSESTLQQLEEARKQKIRDQIDAMYDPSTMGGEETKISEATRQYYTDILNRSSAAAERNTRFNLARSGQLGGSAQSDKMSDILSDKNLGATRIDQAVRQAVQGLKTQRENERLGAYSLVDTGTGSEAINAASTGLKNAFNNAMTANRADLFGDLFAGTADAAVAQQNNALQNALIGKYTNALNTYFNKSSSPGGSGRVTATN